MLEAIALAEEAAGRKLDWSLGPEPRIGDHIWWISDIRKFRRHYPEWRPTRDCRAIIAAIAAEQRRRLSPAPTPPRRLAIAADEPAKIAEPAEIG
jgi:CDP-paratose 2-epimerase